MYLKYCFFSLTKNCLGTGVAQFNGQFPAGVGQAQFDGSNQGRPVGTFQNFPGHAAFAGTGFTAAQGIVFEFLIGQILEIREGG